MTFDAGSAVEAPAAPDADAGDDDASYSRASTRCPPAIDVQTAIRAIARLPETLSYRRTHTVTSRGLATEPFYEVFQEPRGCCAGDAKSYCFWLVRAGSKVEGYVLPWYTFAVDGDSGAILTVEDELLNAMTYQEWSDRQRRRGKDGGAP